MTTARLLLGCSVMLHRVARSWVICTGGQGYVCHLGGKVSLTKLTLSARWFGTSPGGIDDNKSGSKAGESPRVDDDDSGSKAEESPSSVVSSATPFSRQATLLRRRRPLSPLERVSQLLPQDTLSQEVFQLRDARPEEEDDKPGEGQENVQTVSHENGSVEQGTLVQNHLPNQTEADKEGIPRGLQLEGNDTHGEGHVALPGERPMCFGEVLLSEYQRKRQEFRKMFQLTEGARLQSNWGVIRHEDIAGHPAGTFLRTNHGFPILVRRPSLEEFTLYMKRGPAISYPKDASAMLMMMDVCEGDCVLESGSGTGAMTLFLSRAVGSKGTVLSLEVRHDHHKRAVKNYQRWRASWSLRRGEAWPDNVQLHHADLRSAGPLLAGRGFNSVALDMVNPHLVLPTIVPHIHPGGVCTVYLANITQIVDLLEGLRCMPLSLVCERIIDVQCTRWLLAPALKKDGTLSTREDPRYATNEEVEGESTEAEIDGQAAMPFGSVPYIARPHPEQMGHTAFLVKLRKIQK